MPRIDVSEAYNSNVAGSSGFGGRGHRDDFVTYLTPSVSVTADTPRLQGSLFYAPTVQLYAYNGNQDSVGHNLTSSATLTVLADGLFINANAYAAVQPRFGGVSSGYFGGFGGGAANLSRDQQTQTASFSVEPYAVHRFGDVGTAKVGYTYTKSYNNGYGTSFGNSGFVPNGAAFEGFPQQNLPVSNGNSDLSTNRETGQFTTGEILGRLRSVTLLSASQYSGSGVDTGAYENFFTNQLGYAITHRITAFAEGGYEDIRYNTFPVTKIDDAIWSVGAQVTPDPDSSVTVGYGHKYGFNSAFANGSYAVTQRTRLTAVYQTGLGTALQGIQDVIGNSALDAFGNPVDATTGAPSFVSSGQLGVTGNNALYRLRQFTVTGSTFFERDTYSLSLTGTDENLVGTALGTNAFNGGPIASSQSSYSAIATWRHDLTPDLSSAFSLTYGRARQSGQSTSDQTFGADVLLSQVLTETLSGYARYTFYDRSSDVPGLGYTQNVLLIGLSKSF